MLSKTELNSIFIPELNSKQPVLWLFNFGAEEKLSSSSYPQLIHNYEKLITKASILLRDHDWILTSFSNEENKILTNKLGINLTNRKSLPEKKFKILIPWVYTNEVHNISKDKNIPTLCNPSPEIYSKESMLAKLNSTKSYIIDSEKKLIEANNTNAVLLIKGLYSSSGRKQIKISKPTTNHEATFIDSLLKQHGRVLVEPYDHVTRNFSALFSTTSSDIFFSEFVNQNHFSYQETNDVYENHQFEIDRKKEVLENIEACKKHLNSHGYTGPASMDFYEYEKDQKLKIRTFTELNARITFGHIALYKAYQN